MGFQTGIAYLASIFDVLSTLNTSLQGKRSDTFSHVDKIDSFKRKIDCWVNKVSINDYCPSQFLNEFLSEEVEDTSEIKELVLEHFKLPRKIFNRYFHGEDPENFRLLKWVVNCFIFPCQQHEEIQECAMIFIWRKSLIKSNGIFFCAKKGQQF
ncbi:unnamed protein product [Clavelina lepadiformis]|uniref:Uncharacterized protein n=1 Tax=Clavelina lepadiformis TaxID=159417 RepID=A0ABP0GD62_CLALP